MNVFSKTRKAHCWNEDRFINGRNYFIVLDGATPLKSNADFNEARWMVDYIKSRIKSCNGSVKEKLAALSSNAYHDLPIKIKDDDYLPSASCCWVEFNQNILTACVLGDCEVTVKTKVGAIIRCFSDELSKLDNIALNKLIEICAQKNTSQIIESRKFINDILIKHRKLANKPNGYSALTLSPTPIINEKSFAFPVEDIAEIYLYSDGFSQAFEHLQIYKSHQEMFEQINDPGEEICKIVKASFEDRSGAKHPRFKIIDDITVTKIVL